MHIKSWSEQTLFTVELQQTKTNYRYRNTSHNNIDSRQMFQNFYSKCQSNPKGNPKGKYQKVSSLFWEIDCYLTLHTHTHTHTHTLSDTLKPVDLTIQICFSNFFIWLRTRHIPVHIQNPQKVNLSPDHSSRLREFNKKGQQRDREREKKRERMCVWKRERERGIHWKIDTNKKQ